MKRPGNAIRPCRICSIKAQRRADTRGSYYVPYTWYNYENQPLCQDLWCVINLVDRAVDNRYRIEHRITCSSILLEFRSIYFLWSFPTNIIHYVLLNIILFLYCLWNGIKFKIDDLKTKGNYIDRFLELPFYYLNDIELKMIGLALAKSRS